MRNFLFCKGLLMVCSVLGSLSFLVAQEDTLPKLKWKETYEDKVLVDYVKYDKYGRPIEVFYKRVKEEQADVRITRRYFSNPDTFSMNYLYTRPYDLETYIQGMKEYHLKEVVDN